MNKIKTNWTRFSLLNLMALATIVAVWQPWWLARNEPARLQTEIDLMTQSLGLLVVNDPSEFVAVKLPKFSTDLETWRFHIPDDMQLEACLAMEGIHDLGLPEDFKRFKLPAGKHEMSLVFKNNREYGFRHEVYFNGELRMKHERPVEWLETDGSSSQDGFNSTSAVYDLTTPQTLKRLIYSPVLRTNTYESLHLSPDPLASAKGCHLWIQPIGLVAKPTPNWIDKTNSGAFEQFGIREGVRLYQQYDSQPGLKIHHAHSMTRDLPLATIFMEFESDEADRSMSTRNVQFGSWKFSSEPDSYVQPNFRLNDQRRQSFYLIHERKVRKQLGESLLVPIVEILFDLHQPDDIGFRLVRPENGVAVTRWKLRVIHHCKQYWKTLTTEDGSWSPNDELSHVELARLPVIQHNDLPHRAIEVRSLVEDPDEWSKLNIRLNQRFESKPQRHTWLVPASAISDDSPVNLSIQVSTNDEKLAPIAGGPVINEVILDIENPDDSIHWYRVDVQPFNE